MPNITLKDSRREVRIYGFRSLVAGTAIIGCLAVLLLRYWDLQIANHEEYRTQSDRNRVQLQALPPKRGLIFDRNGVLLADNRPSFTLSLVRERVRDLDATLRQLREIVPISGEDIDAFERKSLRRRPYDPVPLRYRLSESERARLAVRKHDLPGVVVEAQLLRHYPHGELFAHAVGYVGRINEREAEILDPARYRGTFHVGKVGLERYYEDELHGEVGFQNVETNAHGRVLRVLERTDPVPGKNVYLNLDIELQRTAQEALGEQRGAVVAMDVRDGGVLALVSTPAFDGNLFVNGISSRDYSALRDSPDVPLFNRAVQGQYPPGSTIKPFMGIAGLQAELVTPESTVPDPGWYRLPGKSRLYRDWTLSTRGGGHAARVDLHMAIAESCDVYFYDLARRLTIDGMHDYLQPFGLGSRTGLDTTNESPGVLPSSAWKRDAMNQAWFPGETLSAGIGQGYMLTTPVQLALATTVLATRGESYEPRLAARVGEQPVTAPRERSVAARQMHWDVVHAGMRAVVHGDRGTARAIGRGIRYTMAGKTGTAQVIGIAQNDIYREEEVDARHRHHGLFIAFAPYESPVIAVAVIVENGGGSAAAYPIARTVIDHWLLGERRDA